MSRELLDTVDALSREKNLPDVFGLLEQAFERTLRRREFGDEKPTVSTDGTLIPARTLGKRIRVTIDRVTGQPSAVLIQQDGTEEDLEIGHDRIMTSAFKQRFHELIKIAQKEALVRTLLDHGDLMLRGTVRAIKKGDLMLEIAPMGLEAVIPRQERIHGIDYRIGDTVEGYWLNATEWSNHLEQHPVGDRSAPFSEVKFDRRVVLSLRSSEWLRAWLHREVEEIHDETIAIVKISRKAGVRAKVALRADDTNDDPVTVVRGFKGARWKRLGETLAPEQVDFLVWHDDPVECLIQAMNHIEIQQVSYDENKKTIDLSIAEDSMAKAVGKGGVNLMLLSDLLGLKVRAHDPSMWHQREAAENELLCRLFSLGLGLSRENAERFCAAGLSSVEEIAYISMDEALALDVADEDVWKRLQAHARAWLNDTDNVQRWLDWERSALPAVDVLAFQEAGIASLADLADLATDELLEKMPAGFDEARARRAIMMARDVMLFATNESNDSLA